MKEIRQNKNIAWLLALCDTLVIAFAFALGRALVLSAKPLAVWHDPLVAFIILLHLLLLYVFNAYDIFSDDLGMSPALRGLLAELVVVLGFALFVLATPLRYVGGNWGRTPIAVAIALIAIWVGLSRWLVVKIFYRTIVKKKRNVIFIAPDEVAKIVTEEFALEKNLFVWQQLSYQQFKQKEAIKEIKKADIVVFYRLDDLPNSWLESLNQRKMYGQNTYDLASFYEIIGNRLPVLHLSTGWFIYAAGFKILQNTIMLRLKRVSDIVISFLMLLFLSPLILVTAVVLALKEGRPVFFSQVRNGLNGNEFTIYKFRTMIKDAEKGGAKWATKNDARIHPLGKFLRLTRIDELPQLWNVLRGDMSFVGPRPERPEFNRVLEKKIPFYRMRYLVRPGITGWAQVNYPYGASEEDARRKLEYDLYYIKNFSLLLDAKIIVRTVRTVLFARGR